jgi:hypothetical protein
MLTYTQLAMFAGAMLGHFVGDYLLQNQWMATEKSQPGKRGHIACTVHVLLYTLAVALFTVEFKPLKALLNPHSWHPLFLLVVAVPHWIIDRWSLAKYLLAWKNGYTMHEVWKEAPLCAAPAPGQLEQNVWKVAFAAPVYIFNDNTIHWVCLWFTVKFFFF